MSSILGIDFSGRQLCYCHLQDNKIINWEFVTFDPVTGPRSTPLSDLNINPIMDENADKWKGVDMVVLDRCLDINIRASKVTELLTEYFENINIRVKTVQLPVNLDPQLSYLDRKRRPIIRVEELLENSSWSNWFNNLNMRDKWIAADSLLLSWSQLKIK